MLERRLGGAVALGDVGVLADQRADRRRDLARSGEQRIQAARGFESPVGDDRDGDGAGRTQLGCERPGGDAAPGDDPRRRRELAGLDRRYSIAASTSPAASSAMPSALTPACSTP
jgi:hypothetical protein